MAGFFKKMFGGNDTSVIGVDFGSSSVKVVQLRDQGGKAVLETYGSLALGPFANLPVGKATDLPTEKRIEALMTIIREARVTSQDAGFAIPFSSSLVSLIKMPELDEKELARMVPIEARKYIPVPISEVVFDWWIVPRDTIESRDYTDEEKRVIEHKVDVLIVAIHNETIEEYRTLITESGLTSRFLEIEIFSAVRATLTESINPLMVMDLGAATSKIYIVEQGVVRSSHIVNRGGQDITTAISQSLGVNLERAEELKREFGIHKGETTASMREVVSTTLHYIFNEAERIRRAYEAENKKPIERAVLIGGGSALKGIMGFGKEILHTQISIADPFSKVTAPAFVRGVLQNAGPEFAVSLGIALRQLQELRR